MLFFLFQRWSLAFNVWVNYKQTAIPAEATMAVVVTKPHGEKGLVETKLEEEEEEEKKWEEMELKKSNGKGKKKRKGKTGKVMAKEKSKQQQQQEQQEQQELQQQQRRRRLTFINQHRTYVLSSSSLSSSSALSSTSSSPAPAAFHPRRPSTHLLLLPSLLSSLPPVGPYTGTHGHKRAACALRQYGPNALDVSIPPLLTLLVNEALSPVTVLKLLDLILSAADHGPPSVLLMSAFQFIAFRYRCASTVRANLRKLREEVVKEEEKGGEAGEGGPRGRMRVWREGGWVSVTAKQLVPGDVLEMRGDEEEGRMEEGREGGRKGGKKGRIRREVPADLLIMQGQIVVDEAILTGESLPQLKTPPSVGKRGRKFGMGKAVGGGTPGEREGGKEEEEDEEEEGEEEGEYLDMEGKHRPHILFSGTRVLRIEGQRLVARVLRTGYFSTQGELLRMIDFRQHAQVDIDSPDTLKLFAGLGLVAVAAAAGVIWKGSGELHTQVLQKLQQQQEEEEEEKEGGEEGGVGLPVPTISNEGGKEEGQRELTPELLLLRATRLLARGIPFWLLDMLSDTVSGAVNILASGKAQMLCTEPFRIPLAGSVNTCIFDKTGTLTTEHLTLRGVVVPPSLPLSDGDLHFSASSSSSSLSAVLLSPPSLAPLRTQQILAACHSLVEVEGQLMGDSLELSALRGNGGGWTYDGRKGVVSRLTLRGEGGKRGEKEGGKEGGNVTESLVIEKRFPFSAALQRMSVVVREEGGGREGGREGGWEW